MYEKERRSSLEEPQERRRRNLCFITIAVILCFIGVGVVSAIVVLYMQSLEVAQETKINDDYLRKLVRQINDSPKTTWKAKFNKFGVRNKSYGFKYTRNATAIEKYVEKINQFFDSALMKKHIQELMEFPEGDLPTHFDARLKWPYCPSISHVPNQGGCGSCYAVAAAGVASDRACIQSNGTFRSMLSEDDLLGCCSVCGNCYGGDPLKALTYWVTEGLVTGGRDGCRPYSFDHSCGVPCSPATFFAAEQQRTCVRQCQNIYYKNTYDEDKHFASLAYSMYPRSMSISSDGKERTKIPTIIGFVNETFAEPLSLTQIRNILMKEIFLFGSTTMAFPVPEEFLHYSSGVFHPYPLEGFEDRIVYWHVVRLIGWGHTEDGAHYWLAMNSFGSHWGDGGTFKINVDSMEKYGLEYEAGLV